MFIESAQIAFATKYTTAIWKTIWKLFRQFEKDSHNLVGRVQDGQEKLSDVIVMQIA